MNSPNAIRYSFDGPIPEARFTESQVLRLFAIAKVLSEPNLQDGLEELAFAIVSRIVLNTLIAASGHSNRGS